MSIFSRYKKVFLIIGFVAIVIFFGYLLYRFFFQEEGTGLPNIIPGATTTAPGGLPSIGPGGEIIDAPTGPGQLPGLEGGGPNINTPIGQPSQEAQAPALVADGGRTQAKPLTTVPVLNPTLTNNGNIQYYNRDDGRFYRIDETGNAVRLSDRVFHQVSQVTWAPNSSKAIIEYPDKSKILYDFNAQKQVTLPSYWEDFSFAGNSDQVVAKSIGLDPDNRWLVVAGADGSKATAIEPIGDRADFVYPSWSPNNQIIAMYTEGVDFDRNEIFFVGQNNENFKSTIVEGRGLQTQWSENGDKLLYSSYHSRDNYIPRLWIVGASGDNIGTGRRNLDLNTWANKCTFASNSEIYCAVPESLEAGAGMFPELADRSQDSLYKIDLNTGAKTLIAVPDGAFNVSDIMVPGSQNYLYFTDKTSGLIYQIRLK